MGTKLFWSEREARVDSDIAVSKFEIQWYYYVHFQTNTHEKV